MRASRRRTRGAPPKKRSFFIFFIPLYVYVHPETDNDTTALCSAGDYIIILYIYISNDDDSNVFFIRFSVNFSDLANRAYTRLMNRAQIHPLSRRARRGDLSKSSYRLGGKLPGVIFNRITDASPGKKYSPRDVFTSDVGMVE